MANLVSVKTLDMVNGEITKVAYDGAAYERVEGEAQIGDIVLVKEAWGDQNVGEFFVVTYTKSGISDQIVGMNGNTCEASSYKCRLKIFRKIAAATNPSVEERVTKAEGEIELLKSDVAALKGEAEYKRIGKSEAQAGDYVKFDDPPSYLTDKEYYEIIRLDLYGDPQIIDDEEDEFDTYGFDFEVYRKAGAASVEAEPKPERLKVGDYAKVVQEYHHQNGEIIILRDRGSERSDTFPFQSERLDGTTGDIFGHRHLVRATDEEVAEAKRATAERKKWAEIGRGVGEYKVGDVVAYDDPEWFQNSGIGEVIELMDGTPCVLATDSRGSKVPIYVSTEQVELVTPVEARFDR
ncbi:hypothetical protein HC660_26930 [Bacillus mojavensis]|uniref:Uncharacterized protein n=1 Tax=Bacillus mojavensis TaxID=72360 RepID=A0ABX6LZY6_BACMO|nr:hypothetical protein [Bacillus mojavensis]QJC97167.1 hypothetical protein HC660_26930 [Bacillus mojavensis]